MAALTADRLTRRFGDLVAVVPNGSLAGWGALIENPAIVGSLSGRDNLRSLAALRGLPASRIDAVIETVGLTGRDGDRTGNGTHSSAASRAVPAGATSAANVAAAARAGLGE